MKVEQRTYRKCYKCQEKVKDNECSVEWCLQELKKKTIIKKISGKSKLKTS